MELPSELPSAFPLDQQWFTVPIPRDKLLTGYVAGPMVGIRGHWVANRSRPCVEWMTHGEEPCPLCAQHGVRAIVYLPFFSGIAFERLVIILCKTTFQMMSRAKFGDYFTATQNPQEKRAAIVKLVPDAGTLADVRPDLVKAGPQDVRTYLTHLWGMAPKKKKVTQRARRALDKLPPVEQTVADPEELAKAKALLRQRLAEFARGTMTQQQPDAA